MYWQISNTGIKHCIIFSGYGDCTQRETVCAKKYNKVNWDWNRENKKRTRKCKMCIERLTRLINVKD